MTKRGRKKREDIWINYHSGPDKSVICKHCDHLYKVANSSKMLSHLMKCDRCPVVIKNGIQKKNENIASSTKAPAIASPHPSIGTLHTENNASSNENLIQPSTSSAHSDRSLVQPLTEAAQSNESLKQRSTSFAQSNESLIQPSTSSAHSHAQSNESLIQPSTSSAHSDRSLVQPLTAAAQSNKSLIQRSTSSPQSNESRIQPSTSSAQSNESLIQQSTSAAQLFEEDKFSSLTMKFAKAVYVSGLPLSLFEHPLWIDFYKDLQPLFKLPSRKNLATTLLDKVHTEIKKEVTECLKTSYLHLQCDGWTNVNNEGVINFIISNPEPYFVKSLSTEDNKHTSDYLSEEIMKILRAYGESKFVVLIGDNARNLQKAFELVKNSNPQIVPLNCAAHTLNLLTQDIIKCDIVKGITEIATDVIKTIKRSQGLSSLLQKIIKEKKSGETWKLPGKTRWGSHIASLKSLVNTKTALMTLAIHEAAAILLPSETKATLLNNNYWSMVEDCITILEPVTGSIFKLESNECNIHSVFTTFKDIKSKMEFILPNITMISDENQQLILNAVEKRTKDCVKPIHLAAYLLDPKTQGLALNEDEDLEAMSFIEQMAQNLNTVAIVDLANYKAREGFWSKRFIWDKVDRINPVTWWKGLCSSKNLSKVAVRILTAPCTSAATERSLSKQGHIHSRKRNRLTPERAAKLTYVSYNWDLLHKQDINEFYGDQRLDDFRNNPISEEETLDTRSREFELFNCGSLNNSDEE